MDYSIISEKLIGLSDGTASVIAELVASESEAIPYYNTVSGRTFAPGSTAIVPSESAVYILDTDLLWTQWGSGEKLPAPEDDDDENSGSKEDQNA